MNKIYEGQEVYYLYFGHGQQEAAELIATTVTKVGRKWFEVAEINNTRFSIETLKNDAGQYSSSSRIILSLVDYINEQEKNRLYDKIAKRFDFYSKKDVTLEQLRKIYKVLNSDQNVQVSDTTGDHSSTKADNQKAD